MPYGYECRYGTFNFTVDNLNDDDWNCEICGKSTKDVEYDYIGSGTNHLKCELTDKESYKDKALELQIENAELRDRLTELGEMIEKTKKVRSL